MSPDFMKSFFVLVNVLIGETLLNIDNALVIGGVLSLLPADKRMKHFGILIVVFFFAYLVLNIISSWLVMLWWLEPVMGLMLIASGVSLFRKSKKQNAALLVFAVLLYQFLEIIQSEFYIVGYTTSRPLIYAGILLAFATMIILSFLMMKYVARWFYFKVLLAFWMLFLGIYKLLTLLFHYSDSEVLRYLYSGNFVAYLSVSIVFTILVIGILNLRKWAVKSKV